MRVRTAYISSIGTTTILVAASLLMLGVVSALVSFHGWPGGAVGLQVPSVALQPDPPPAFRLARHVTRTAPYQRVLADSRALGSRTATVGLVKDVSARVPLGVGFPLAVSPGHVPDGAPATSAVPGAPRAPAPSPPAPRTPAQPSPSDVEALVVGLAGAVQPPPGAGASLPALGLPLPGVQIPLPR